MTDGLPRLRLWGVGTSRTLRPHWLLAELGLPYECREILPRSSSMQDPAFRALAPRGKVPILEDGGLVVGESGAGSPTADRTCWEKPSRSPTSCS